MLRTIYSCTTCKFKPRQMPAWPPKHTTQRTICLLYAFAVMRASHVRPPSLEQYMVALRRHNFPQAGHNSLQIKYFTLAKAAAYSRYSVTVSTTSRIPNARRPRTCKRCRNLYYFVTTSVLQFRKPTTEIGLKYLFITLIGLTWRPTAPKAIRAVPSIAI